MSRHWPALALALALLVAAATACGSDGAGRSDGTLDVVASFYPLAEAAARVGGDRVHVRNLTPPGVEPHAIELTSKDVDRIEDADVVVYVGGDFQPAIEEVAGRIDGEVVDVLHALDLDAGNSPDPHFWLDPTMLRRAAEAIEQALADAAPDAAAAFAANAKRYGDELAAFDVEMRRGLAHCERHEIVTTHEAFGYLAKRYGLEQVSIAALSPEAEPDPKRLADLADRIAADGITTVFTETLVSPKVAETLAREAHVETAVLDPVESLDKDRIDHGDEYADVMRDNLVVLRHALGCS